jgi:RND family efflux transporter MFP subunit
VRRITLIAIAVSGLGSQQINAQQLVDAVTVISLPTRHNIELTGELLPWQQTALRAATIAVVERVLVDRGSRVAQGQLLAVLAVIDHADVNLTAPYAGVITARYAHPGAITGPQAEPLFDLQQITRLRLVIPIPEEHAGGIPKGVINFKVPAFPGNVFTGSVARNPSALDPKTHTLPVELDVPNPAGRLLPGMRAVAVWPVMSQGSVIEVPAGAITVSGQRTFVIRIRNSLTEWVDVVKGAPSGDLIAVQGGLDAGDVIARHGTGQLRPGTRVQANIR